MPSDGFLAAGEHHHVCVHLVNLDTDNRGDVVVLALARTLISLPCYLPEWLAVLRSGAACLALLPSLGGLGKRWACLSPRCAER